jgi:hypothetical protein
MDKTELTYVLPVSNDDKIELVLASILDSNDTFLAVHINNLAPQLDNSWLARSIWIQSSILQLLMHINTMIEVPLATVRLLNMVKSERWAHVLQGVTFWPTDLNVLDAARFLGVETP